MDAFGFPGPRGVVPVGAIIVWGNATVPSGYVLCDGTSYEVNSYPGLFLIIGYTFGGSGRSFNVPDLRSSCVVGAGQGAGLTNRVLGTAGGEETHLLATAEIPSHTHTISDVAANTTDAIAGQPLASAATTGSTGGGGGHNNMQPFLSCHHIIKT